MNRKASIGVPPGLVKSLTSQWESNTGEPKMGEFEQRRTIPQLNNRSLQEILRPMCGDVEVWSLTSEQVRENDSNHVSNVLVVQVLLSNQSTVDIFYKSINSSSPKAKMFNFKELFKKEALMYSTVIPALKEINQNVLLQVFPNCHHTSNDVIILENLLSYGYHNVDHGTGLDAAHCKLVFTELGRFHAAAHILYASGSGDDLETVGKEVLYNEERSPLYEEYFKELAECTVDIIKTNPKSSRYTRNVKEIVDNVYVNLLKCLKFKGNFLTLTHGDLRSDNLMFLYSDEMPIRVKFLDFQTCRFGSPALDIIHLLYTSTTAEIRECHMDDFMRTYHRSLSLSMRQMGADNEMSLMDLRREVDSMPLYGLLTAHLELRNAFAGHNAESDVKGDLFSKRIVEIALDLGERRVF